MITITNTTQRIFFEPSIPLDDVVDICDPPGLWLLNFGVFSDCGAWDDDAVWNDTPTVTIAETFVLNNVGQIVKRDIIFFPKNSRLYEIPVSFFANLPDEDYTLKIIVSDDAVYSTRLKIKRQSVEIKSNAQPVTRKVNRITI